MISMPFGKTVIPLDEPDQFELAVPEYFKKDSNLDKKTQKKLIKDALINPTERPNLSQWLKKEDSVAVIVPDITRQSASSLYLESIMQIIEVAGISPCNVNIIIATGNHRDNTTVEMRKITGDEILKKYNVENHNSKKNLVNIGTTPSGNRIKVNYRVAEADKIILTGAAAFHIFAGYSGGRKGILPGVCGVDTILYNHSLMFRGQKMNDCAQIGVLENNPVNEDMIDTLGIFGCDKIFLFNVVCNLEGSIIKAFAGSPVQAHHDACLYVLNQFSVKYNHGFDLLVMSSGGFPFDNSFYQAYKGAYCLLNALNENGKIIIMAECSEGYGEQEKNTSFWFSKTKQELLNCCENNFDMNGKVAFDIQELLEKTGGLYLVTEENDKLFNKIGAGRIHKGDINRSIKQMIEDFTKENCYSPKVCFVPYGTNTLVINTVRNRCYKI